MRGRKKSTKEANAEYLQKQGGTEVAEQKKQQEQDLNQLLKVRREKLADLQANGKDPFKIVKYDVTHHSQEIKDHFDELESQTVTIAGRMMSKRVMGKASFCHVQDLEGSIQSYVARDSLGEEADDVEKLMRVFSIENVERNIKTHTRGGIYITFNSSDNIKKNDLFEIKLYDKYYYFEAESIKVIGKLLEVQATETGYWANKLSNLKQDIDLRDAIDVEVFPIKDEKKNSAN